MPQVVTWCDSISHSILKSRVCEASENLCIDTEQQKSEAAMTRPSRCQYTAIKNTRLGAALSTRMCHPISSLHVRCDTALSILFSYIYCFPSVRDVEMPLFDRAPPFNSYVFDSLAFHFFCVQSPVPFTSSFVCCQIECSPDDGRQVHFVPKGNIKSCRSTVRMTSVIVVLMPRQLETCSLESVLDIFSFAHFTNRINHRQGNDDNNHFQEEKEEQKISVQVHLVSVNCAAAQSHNSKFPFRMHEASSLPCYFDAMLLGRMSGSRICSHC